MVKLVVETGRAPVPRVQALQHHATTACTGSMSAKTATSKTAGTFTRTPNHRIIRIRKTRAESDGKVEITHLGCHDSSTAHYTSRHFQGRLGSGYCRRLSFRSLPSCIHNDQPSQKLQTTMFQAKRKCRVARVKVLGCLLNFVCVAFWFDGKTSEQSSPHIPGFFRRYIWSANQLAVMPSNIVVDAISQHIRV